MLFVFPEKFHICYPDEFAKLSNLKGMEMSRASQQNSLKPRVTLIQGVTHHHKSDADIIYWSYQSVPKDKFLVASYLVGVFLWTAAVIYITSLLFPNNGVRVFNEKIVLLYFSIGGWVVAFYLLRVILSLFSTEMIAISDTKIIHKSSAPFSHTEYFNKDRIRGISFEKYAKSGEGWEMLPTLNILYSAKLLGFSYERREVVAYWMRTKEKYQLYLLLASVLKDRGWDIEYRLRYQPK